MPMSFVILLATLVAIGVSGLEILQNSRASERKPIGNGRKTV